MFPNDPEYQNHKIFTELQKFIGFYERLSFNVMSWLPQGTEAIFNIDTFVFSSLKGTLSSIHLILKDGRINDAWALLRKFHDSIIINIYSNLYLKDNFGYSYENWIVEQINDWLHGKSTLPEFRVMSKYIREHPDLEDLNNLVGAVLD